MKTMTAGGRRRKPRTRAEMISYLSNHFRYNTMNPWNRSSSYAANIKLHHVVFPDAETRNRAYELLDVAGTMTEFDRILAEFSARHAYQWQIHRNGKSGGYLVLYQGSRKVSEYKSQCLDCGQLNFTEATEENRRCGRCGENERENVTLHDINYYPGRGCDEGEDFTEWETYSLRERVDLVWDFDQTVKRAVESFVRYCKGHEAVERVVMVPRTVRSSAPLHA